MWRSPVPIATTPLSLGTLIGLCRSAVVPSPSCPKLLAPHAGMVPLDRIARLCSLPAATATTPVSPETCRGVSIDDRAVPELPSVVVPHAHTVKPGHPDRGEPLRRGAVTKLSVVVVTPRPDGAVGPQPLTTFRCRRASGTICVYTGAEHQGDAGHDAQPGCRVEQAVCTVLTSSPATVSTRMIVSTAHHVVPLEQLVDDDSVDNPPRPTPRTSAGSRVGRR